MLEPRDVESVGKVMDNVIVEIIDNEICVSGPNVMKGYWNQPNLLIVFCLKRIIKSGIRQEILDFYLIIICTIQEEKVIIIN